MKKLKIKIITSIKPNKYNTGGPSGLIWECEQVLKENNIQYDMIIIEDKSFINKMGIYFKKYSHKDETDILLVYPFHTFYYLDKKLRKKAIVLGPDSPSLLYKRFYKNSISFLMKTRNFILYLWFFYKEKVLLKEVYKIIVVGKNDVRWLKRIHNFGKSSIYYLTHPILQSIVEGKKRYKEKSENTKRKTLVLVGDLRPKYTGRYIIDFVKVLDDIDWDILIVGKFNKWIYNLFINKSKKNNIYFIDWVENYAEICNPIIHVHLIPLSAGAGTKNRTLSACAMGVTIISTYIGLENVLYGKPPNLIFKFKKVEDIPELIKIKKDIFAKKEIDTNSYIKSVNERFKKELLKYLYNKEI